MAQLAVVALGAAVGYGTLGAGVVAMGLTGAQIGFMVGSIAGQLLFAPSMNSEGPKLNDLSVTGASYGAPIPYLEGHPRIAGLTVWSSGKREIETTEDVGGKGGSSTQTTYTYEVDLLFLLADNEISDVTRIWSNGKLIYSKIEGSPAADLDASDNTNTWTRMTVYTGAADQLPDPDYEAVVGVGNAPAYRTRGTVFIKSLGLGGSGQIPNLTFEVATIATQNRAFAFTVPYYRVQKFNPATGELYETSDDPLDGSNPYYDVLHFPEHNRVVATDDGFTPAPYCVAYNDDTLDEIERVKWRGGADLWTEPWRMCRAATHANYFFATEYSSDASGETLFYKVDPQPLAILNAITESTYLRRGAMPWVKLSPTDNKLAIGIESKTIYTDVVKFYDPVTLSVLGTTTLFNSPPLEAISWGGTPDGVWSKSGNHLFVLSAGSLKVIDATTYTVTSTINDIYQFASDTNGSATPSSLALSVDGRTLYVGYEQAVGLSALDVRNPSLIKLRWHKEVESSGGGMYAYGFNRLNMASDGRRLYASVPSSSEVICIDVRARALDDRFQSPMELTSANYGNVTIGKLYDTAVLGEPTVREVVERLCARAGLQPSQYDAVELDAISKPVRGMSISQVSTIRQVIESLMGTHFFHATLSDKIYFRPRGGAAVTTLAYEDIGIAPYGTDVADAFPITQTNDLEVPAQVAITYSNVNGDYQTDTQYSDRLLTGQESTQASQLSISMNAEEAKQIADFTLLDMAVAATSSKFSVDVSKARLEPTDVVVATTSDGSQYRMRIMRKSDERGVITFDAVLDDTSILTQDGVTDGFETGQTSIVANGITEFLMLDIPLLRETDDVPGHYAVVDGDGLWPGADLYRSNDDVEFKKLATYTTQTAIGFTEDALANFTGGNVFDIYNSVVVDVGAATLSSVTRDALLNDLTLNVMLIGSEVVQFRVATLLSEGRYKLTELLRGRRGTEWATGTHGLFDDVAVLGTSGLKFIALDLNQLGRTFYYKAVTAGYVQTSIGADAFVPTGNNLKPFSPVNARANRTTTDTEITWTRRTRYSTRYVGGFINVPLGEETESYEIEIWNSTFTTLKRTILSATPTATYTAADQTTDFGAGQTTLYVKIYQMSSRVGRGFALTATI